MVLHTSTSYIDNYVTINEVEKIALFIEQNIKCKDNFIIVKQ